MKSKKLMTILIAGAALMGATFGGCGNPVNDDAVFATLDDTKITMGVANFFAKYQQVMYDTSFMGYYGEDMWNNDLYGNGSALKEDVKNNVAEDLQKLYLLKAHMEEYGISISEDEEAALAKAVDNFIADNSKAAIRQIGAENKENAIEMLRLRTIEKKMRDRIIQDADTTVSDEEAAQRTFSYLQISTAAHTDENNNQVEYTEEEKAGLKTVAEGIAASSPETFETAVTDSGYTLNTASYGSAEDENASMDKAVLEAADALTEGQISGVVETDSAYYVLRLDKAFDEEATASKREELIKEKQENYYTDVIDGWKDESKWEINESEWEKVTFEEYFKLPEEEDTESLSEESTESGNAAENATENAADNPVENATENPLDDGSAAENTAENPADNMTESEDPAENENSNDVEQ